MVGSEIKNLVNNEEFTLPSNARSIMIQIIDGGDSGGVSVETSHDGVTWHQVGQPIAYTAAPVLTSYDDGSENFLQKIKITGLTANASVNLYFGRSK
jgi:hypothetical protein